MENKKIDIALLALRIGLAIVFLLFGYHKLSSPTQTTAEIQLLLNFLGLAAASAINFYLGLAETVIAIGLAVGIKTRLFGIAAAILTTGFFASFFFKFGFSINPDLYRDVGLTAIGIALAFAGAGKYSWENKNQTNTQ